MMRGALGASCSMDASTIVLSEVVFCSLSMVGLCRVILVSTVFLPEVCISEAVFFVAGDIGFSDSDGLIVCGCSCIGSEAFI